jgi:hypothetical protein
MTTVTSRASILSLILIFILLFGLTRPCFAGDNDQSEQIIRKMYSDLLNGNYAGDITSKNNRAKYFVQTLVRLYDASDAAEALGKPPCVDFNIQVNGQDVDVNKLRKSLSIEQTSNDGKRAEIVSKPGPTDTFRYEFVKDSGQWKISDVILPWGQKLSDTAWPGATALAGKLKPQDRSGAESGIYCLDRKTDDFDNAFFAEIHKADGNLIFALDAAKDGFTYSAYGLARKVEANHWRYTDSDPDFKDVPGAACVIDITFDRKNWVMVANPHTPCTTHRGERAPYEAPPFPLESYIGPVPENVVDGPKEGKIGDNLQIMANAGSGSCSFYKRPYTQLYTTFRSPASEGGAPAHAQPGQPSYVGRWMDNPSCRPPYENELKFSTRGMEGDELSCRFDRIRGDSDRWHIRMTCHGEGGTERRDVNILVDGNTMQFKEGGNTSKKTRCP